MIARRDLSKHAGVSSAVAVSLGKMSSAFGQTSPMTNFHAHWPMMVGLNAFSFSRMLNAFALRRKGPGMSLLQLLDYCVEPQHRFDTIDITG